MGALTDELRRLLDEHGIAWEDDSFDYYDEDGDLSHHYERTIIDAHGDTICAMWGYKVVMGRRRPATMGWPAYLEAYEDEEDASWMTLPEELVDALAERA